MMKLTVKRLKTKVNIGNMIVYVFCGDIPIYAEICGIHELQSIMDKCKSKYKI